MSTTATVIPPAAPVVTPAASLLAAHGLTSELRAGLLAQAEAIATRLRLPLRAARGGQAGQWLGSGSGASLEFQDHRQYHPGDDPRHLNWAAFARTGQHTMKMYREEVSPRVDVVLDCSTSMFLQPAKARRTLELFSFVHASALRAGAMLRAYLADPRNAYELPGDSLRSQGWVPLPPAGRAAPPALDRVPWRAQSLRVVITDLLYPVPPQDILAQVLHTTSRCIVLCPWSKSEAEPEWDGQIELRDCESGEKRLFQMSASRRERFRASYRRHFELWGDACAGRGVPMARLGEDGALMDCLMKFALPAGAVELT
ncbi:MAG TPA: DUF58 domain-containing protein [Opitutales bacterium]|jgi:hypothetical protein|nr:DUF58 domain-containing protein [Opitutales bacterium]